MYYLISNPASQSGNDHVRITEKLEKVLRSRNIEYQIKSTENSGDPEKIAAQITENSGLSKEQDTIIVIGGDGTINGVINGIRDFEHVRFGFIPAGSANDLAKGLGIRDIYRSRSQDENIEKIAEGRVLRTIDLGQVSCCNKSRLFAVSAGIGFDAAICRESDVSKIRNVLNALHLGKLTYGAIGLKQLLTAPEAKCRISMDNGTKFRIRKLMFATFMNTPYEGGGYKFAPDAVCDDSLINVSAIGDLSKLTALVHFPAAYKGRYYGVPGVFHSRASEIRVETNKPLWVHTDGEVLGKYTKLTIRCLPHRLRLIM